MSISLDQSNSVSTKATSGEEFLTAAVSKSQQELAGQMALQLISPQVQLTYLRQQAIVASR